MPATILTDTQKCAMTIRPRTAAGNPAQVDGTPVWTSSNEQVLTLSISEDGMSAIAMTTGQLGTAQIQVQADADLGQGVRTITGVADFEVRAGEAVSLGIEVGEPTEKNPVAPPPPPPPPSEEPPAEPPAEEPVEEEPPAEPPAE